MKLILGDDLADLAHTVPQDILIVDIYRCTVLCNNVLRFVSLEKICLFDKRFHNFTLAF